MFPAARAVTRLAWVTVLATIALTLAASVVIAVTVAAQQILATLTP